ncbi:hypothetical protein [uncultured Clostridium sp.]|uniref:hypothetical protein n=1 Tax=uncultured Clostridium sp. TaxID=59620 RepID=UPI0025ED2F6A|nr:hypothetical protein [uncultured Clostridium sp.]
MKYLIRTISLFFILMLIPLSVQGSTTYKKYIFRENEKFLFQYEDKSYFLVNNLQFKNSLCIMDNGNFTPINTLHFSNTSDYLGVFDGNIFFSLEKELWRFNPSDNNLSREDNISSKFIQKLIYDNAYNHSKISANISKILGCFDNDNFLFSFSGKLDDEKVKGIANNKGDYIIIPNDFFLIQSNNDGSIWISSNEDTYTKILKLDSNLNKEEFNISLDYKNLKENHSVLIQDNSLFTLSNKNILDKYQLSDSQFEKVNSTNISKNHSKKLASLTLGEDNYIYTITDNKIFKINNCNMEYISDIPKESNSLFVYSDTNFVASYSHKNPKSKFIQNINLISAPSNTDNHTNITTTAAIENVKISAPTKNTSIYYALTILLLIFITISLFKFNRKYRT